MVWAALENIGLHGGNLKFNTQNKQCLNMPIIICIILPVCLCVGYMVYSKNMLIVIEIIHKSAICVLGQGVSRLLSKN